jgi:hypothetical protein
VGEGEGRPGYNFQLVKGFDQRVVNIKIEKLEMARKGLIGWKGNENGMERMANIQIDKKLELKGAQA